MAVDWLKLKTEYIKDPSLSVDAVAKKHGVNPSYARYIAGQQKWSEQRDKIQHKTSEKLAEKLPETLSEVKLRHARIGRNLQSTAMIAILGSEEKGIKPLRPQNFQDAANALVKGVNIERMALGLNEKEVKDEIYQKFSQFTFIFNLSNDELSNFIKSAFTGGENPSGIIGETVSENPREEGGGQPLASPAVSG